MGPWVAVRINYHEADKAGLLLGAIGPVVDRLADFGAVRAAYRPHWRRGPHAMFALQLSGTAKTPAFPKAALDHIQGWIAAHPSQVALENRDYLALSLKLARAEGAEGPFLPLEPDNTVTETTAGLPLATEGLARVSQDFQIAALPLLIELAALKPNPEAFWLRLAEMLACAAHFSGPAGIPGGQLSFRSHAEGFLSGAEPLRLRFVDFAQQFEGQAAKRVHALYGVLRQDESGTGLDPFLVRWVAVVRDCKARLDAEAASMPRDKLRAAGAQNENRTLSRFERMVLNGALGELRTNPAFIAYRLLLSNVYGLMPVVSVSPVERFAVCYLVAEASTRVFQIDWRRKLFMGSGRNWPRSILAGLLDRLRGGART